MKMIDQVLGAIGWACVTEPGDVVAGEIVWELGAEAAWQWLTVDTLMPVGASESDERVRVLFAGREALLDRRLARWRSRLPDVNVEAQARSAHALGAWVLTPNDPNWPLLLNDLEFARPHCLWVRGDSVLPASARAGVSIIGSREMSNYGEHVTSQLVAGLATYGTPVVSGGAFGVDASAHRAALAYELPTLAVLAGGVDRLYPSGNAGLQRAILAAGGAIVSEMPPGALPMRSRFLQRNRLIAALTPVTLVVEAAWRSGSLSTAHHALELSRQVGAVPGPVTSTLSSGCHRLLRETPATLITSSSDIVELIGIELQPDLGRGGVESPKNSAGPVATAAADPVAASASPTAAHVTPTNPTYPGIKMPPTRGRTPAHTAVLDGLSLRKARSVDEIARACGLLAQEVLPILGELEISGAIVHDGMGWKRLHG